MGTSISKLTRHQFLPRTMRPHETQNAEKRLVSKCCLQKLPNGSQETAVPPKKRIVLQAPGRQFMEEIRMSSKAWARVLTTLRRENPALAKKIDPTATHKMPRSSFLPDAGDYENWKCVRD